jgi:hypothetical protein
VSAVRVVRKDTALDTPASITVMGSRLLEAARLVSGEQADVFIKAHDGFLFIECGRLQIVMPAYSPQLPFPDVAKITHHMVMPKQITVYRDDLMRALRQTYMSNTTIHASIERGYLRVQVVSDEGESHAEVDADTPHASETPEVFYLGADNLITGLDKLPAEQVVIGYDDAKKVWRLTPLGDNATVFTLALRKHAR